MFSLSLVPPGLRRRCFKCFNTDDCIGITAYLVLGICNQIDHIRHYKLLLIL